MIGCITVLLYQFISDRRQTSLEESLHCTLLCCHTWLRCTPLYLGVTVGAKIDVFLENFRRGGKGGAISDPKNYIADFVGFKAVYFGAKFWKKA